MYISKTLFGGGIIFIVIFSAIALASVKGGKVNFNDDGKVISEAQQNNARLAETKLQSWNNFFNGSIGDENLLISERKFTNEELILFMTQITEREIDWSHLAEGGQFRVQDRLNAFKAAKDVTNPNGCWEETNPVTGSETGKIVQLGLKIQGKGPNVGKTVMFIYNTIRPERSTIEFRSSPKEVWQKAKNNEPCIEAFNAFKKALDWIKGDFPNFTF